VIARVGLVAALLAQVAAILLLTAAEYASVGLLIGAVVLPLLIAALSRNARRAAAAIAGLAVVFTFVLILTTVSIGPGFSPPLPTCPDLGGPTRFVQTPFPPILWCAPNVGDGPWAPITSPVETVVLSLVLLLPLVIEAIVIVRLFRAPRELRSVEQP
jgi:Na+/proline symporter